MVRASWVCGACHSASRYGLSGGQQDNMNGGCRQGSYADTGDASASDLRRHWLCS